MEVRRTQPRLGTRKLQHVLRQPLSEAGISVGRDALFGILRQARLLVVPRRAYHKTTNSHHRFHRHPNLLKAGPQQCRPEGAEQVWVADADARRVRLPEPDHGHVVTPDRGLSRA